MKNFLIICGLMLVALSAQANEKMLSESSYEEVLNAMKNKKATMLEFGSNSCYSCKVMGKTLYEIKQEHQESNIFYLNVKKNKEAVMKYKVRMIPTQVFLDENQKVIGTHIGAVKKEELVRGLKQMNIIQ